MTIRYRAKAMSRVVNDGVNTFYSDPRHDGGLAAGERVTLEARTSNVSGTTPTLTVTLETSNDAVDWVVRGTPIVSYPITSGTVVAGAERALSTVGGRFARLGVKLGGTSPNAYVELWAIARDGSAAIGLDLTMGGSFARSSEAAYMLAAPAADGATCVAWAPSGTRRAADVRGDGIGPSLLIERSATNALGSPRDVTNATGWPGAATNASVTTGGASIDGTSNACRIQIGSSPGYSRYIDTLGSSAGRYSLWYKTRNGNPLGAQFGSATPHVLADTGNVWTRADARDGSTGAYTPAWWQSGAGPISAAIDADVDLLQYEDGHYATSPIRTGGETRPADTLSYASGSYPIGFLTSGVAIVFAPDATSAEIVSANEDWRLVQVGASDHVRIRNVSGTCKAELVCGGSVVASLSITFSRAQALTITARPSAGSLTVSGATTGDGTSTGTGAAWASAATLYVGGDSGGTNNVTGRYVGALIQQAR